MAPDVAPALPPIPGLKHALILGGARSGKSRFAEQVVLQSGLDPVYLATAEARDPEMAARIERHRESRDPRFQTLEAPLDLLWTLGREAGPGRAIVVDCLTLWLTNLMTAGRDVESEADELAQGIANLPGIVVLVSNDVGSGVIPMNAMARAFVDHAGRLHQSLAATLDTVVWMVAGLPQVIKRPEPQRDG